MQIYSHSALKLKTHANKFAPTAGLVSQTQPKNEDSNMDSILKKGGRLKIALKKAPNPLKGAKDK